MTLSPLLRKLDGLFALSEEERDAVRQIPVREAEIKADQDIVREDERPTRSFFIKAGVTCAYKHAGPDKRQIVNFSIAGDAPDLLSLHLNRLDMTIATITPCTIGFVQHQALRDLCARHPRVAAALWRETLVDAAIFREWITNVGRRSAPSRTAHLMCEMVMRYRAVGLAEGNEIEFPMTQAEIGDAAGMSTVHVNRSLKALRSMNLIRLEHGLLTVLDWDRLCEVGDFDPGYLHLEKISG